ncbi:MAG: fibronectin type III domain-containing protein [Bacteroidota bacterium]
MWIENNGTTNQVRAAKYAPMTISPTQQLTEVNLNGSGINVSLMGASFTDSALAAGNFVLLNAPTGLSVGSVTHNSGTSCTVNLAYSGSGFDADITNLGLTIRAAELTIPCDLTSVNDLTVLAVNKPTVTTDSTITLVSGTSYTVSGNVISDGNASITERGIEYKKETEADYVKIPASSCGTGAFSVTTPSLDASAVYHFRAYAVNSQGTSYGNTVVFSVGIQTVSITAVDDVSRYDCGSPPPFYYPNGANMGTENGNENWVGFYDGTEDTALKFNLGSIDSAAIISATLKIYISWIDKVTVDPILNVYGSGDDDWSEGGTPAYFPSSNGTALLTNQSISQTGVWKELSSTGLTDYIRSQAAEDGIATFVLTGSTAAYTDFGFYPRSNPSHLDLAPVLLISYKELSPESVSVPVNGIYRAGQNLDFTVTFNRIVSVNTTGGTPYIPVTLDTGGIVHASYIGGDGTAALVFRYTVTAGNEDTNGLSVGASIAANGGTLKDAAGNDAILTLNGVGSTAGVLVDAVAPTVTLSSTAPNPTKTSPIPVTITFSEAVTGFTVGDFTVSNGSLGEFNGSGVTYTVEVIPSGQGPVTVEVAAGMAQDAAGNGNTAAAQLSRTYDNLPPISYSVNIDQAQINNANKTALSFTFTGAEVGATYEYILTSSGGGGPLTGGGSISSAAHQVTGVTTMGLNEGTLTLSVTLTDAAGNTGLAATDTVLKDTLMPSGYSVNIDQAYINNANKTAMSFTITGAEAGATYHYELTSSGGGGLVTGGGTIGSAMEQVVGVTTFGLNEGTLTLSATLTDAAGNTGAAVTDTVLKDTLMPFGYSVTMDQACINNANKTALSFTFTGAEIGAGYSYAISSSGGGAEVTGVGTAGESSGTISDIDVSGLNDGSLTLSFTMTDVPGNPGFPVTDTVTKDTAAPGVAIGTTAGNPTSLVPIPVTIGFNEPVTGFTLEDIAVDNGSAANLNGGGASYSVEITPSAQGAVTVGVAACAAQDAAGNGNTAAESLVLTFAPQANVITDLNIVRDATGAFHLTWTNPGSGWDMTRVVRKENGYPSSPSDGTLIYQGRNSETYDPDLPVGTYYYAAYGSYYGAYAAPATGSITMDNPGDKIRRTFQPGDGGAYSALRTAQSWRGTSYTAWNGAELTLGCGASGAQSGVWLQYKDLIGPLAGQVPLDARIVGARLVLHIKGYEPATRLSLPYTIKIYRVPEDGLAAPHFGTVDGLRAGLDWAYRDHRPGMNVPWATGAADILTALNGVDPLDEFEFIPEACQDEGCEEISLNVTRAVEAWVGDGGDALANQGFFLVIEGGNPGDVIVFDGAAAASHRPMLEVVHGTGADLTGPDAAVAELLAVPGAGQIALSWINPTSDFAGVRIVRRAGRTPFNAYDGVPVYDGTGDSYTDTGLADGTVYYYAAFAYDNCRNYGPKAWVKAVPGTPAAPAGFTATANTGYVSLAWTPVSGATSYRVYRRDGSETRYFEVSAGTSYEDRNVEEKTYTYYVVGLNTVGEGQPSTEAEATLTADALTPSPPSDPRAITVTNTTVTLSWTDNALNETGFIVERSDDNGTTWTERGRVGFDVTTFTDMGLTPGATYRYRVMAVRGSQASGSVETGNVTTTAAPLAPTNLVWNVISAGRVNLAWTGAATGVTGYRVDVCDAAGTVLRSINLGADATSCSVTGLAPGVSYIFKVSAVNGGHEGTARTEIVVTGNDPKHDLL